MATKLLRLSMVTARTGLSESTIYLRMKDPDRPFPAQVRIGPRAVGWVEAEVNDWLNQRIEASRATQVEAGRRSQ